MHYTILQVTQVYLDSAALQIWQGGRFCGGIGSAFLSDEHQDPGRRKVLSISMWC